MTAPVDTQRITNAITKRICELFQFIRDSDPETDNENRKIEVYRAQGAIRDLERILNLLRKNEQI